MSTAVMQECEASWEPLPVCLSPWEENSYKPVTMYMMLAFSARRFYWIGQWLQKTWEDCVTSTGAGESLFPVALLHNPVDEKTKNKALTCLRWVEEACLEIGMPITASTAVDVSNHLKGDRPRSYQWLMDAIHNVQKLIE